MIQKNSRRHISKTKKKDISSFIIKKATHTERVEKFSSVQYGMIFKGSWRWKIEHLN